jgi:hypothetical protein
MSMVILVCLRRLLARRIGRARAHVLGRVIFGGTGTHIGEPLPPPQQQDAVFDPI